MQKSEMLSAKVLAQPSEVLSAKALAHPSEVRGKIDVIPRCTPKSYPPTRSCAYDVQPGRVHHDKFQGSQHRPRCKPCGSPCQAAVRSAGLRTCHSGAIDVSVGGLAIGSCHDVLDEVVMCMANACFLLRALRMQVSERFAKPPGRLRVHDDQIRCPPQHQLHRSQ